MIKIVVVSDIRIYSEGLHHLFAGICTVEVLGAVSTAAAALTLVKELLPDVVLLDMTMEASCELAQNIRLAGTGTRVVALAVPHDEHDILQCAEAGITGYVLREASSEELVEAVVQAGNSGCYCPPRIAACILKRVQDIAACSRRPYPSLANEPAVRGQHAQSLQERLTRREQQIATLLSDGLSNKQIARDLSIEVSTVKNHVHNLLGKLDVKSRSQAISMLQRQPDQFLQGAMDP